LAAVRGADDSALLNGLEEYGAVFELLEQSRA
jgi:hypothetical protein